MCQIDVALPRRLGFLLERVKDVDRILQPSNVNDTEGSFAFQFDTPAPTVGIGLKSASLKTLLNKAPLKSCFRLAVQGIPGWPSRSFQKLNLFHRQPLYIGIGIFAVDEKGALT